MGTRTMVPRRISQFAVATAVAVGLLLPTLGPAAAYGQQVVYQEVARFTLGGRPAGFGSNPAAIAWDGTKMFIAGLNNSGVTASVGIVEVTNATSTGLTSATYGTLFGEFASTGNTRGYSGLDLSGSTLATAYDSGAASTNGIAAYDTSGTFVWGITARGGSGVAFDPGFGDPAAGDGVAWTTFGSGRRALQNSSTGANIYTTSDGMIINMTSGGGAGTFWRSMAFDPATGDIYPRRSNGIFKGVRSGANSLSAVQEVRAAESASDFISGQNIAFMGASTELPSLVVYNNRATTSVGQSFLDVIETRNASTFDLVPQTFVFLDGSTPLGGNGYYDFAYDPGTQTLAILDFTNNTAHVFQAVPEPSSWAMRVMGGSACGGAALRRRRGRDGRADKGLPATGGGE